MSVKVDSKTVGGVDSDIAVQFHISNPWPYLS